MVTITIDTNKDSKEDILKAIAFLKQFAEQDNYSAMPEPPAGAMNIFDDAGVGQKNETDREDGEEAEETPKNIKLQFY